jgi:FecR protein
MNEDYLWNRTGEPDPETVLLENLLGELKYRPQTPLKQRWDRRFRLSGLAVAAAIILGILCLPLFWRGPLTNWQSADGHRIRAGQTIETGKLQSDDTGEVTVDPGSRLRLVTSTNREERFDLQRGTIHAFIWAPPGRFVVETPSSKTIDLGCRYTLQVSQNGTGLLTVELGWVAFERKGIESFIPAGAACITRPDKGPGTPYFSDASPSLTKALARFDAAPGPAALDTAIASARPRDALSLWHLMIRTHGDDRARVFDRFASLVTLPREVTREAVLKGDGKAIDAAWNALDLGDTDWWREWKRPW